MLLTKVSATDYDTTWTTVIPGDRYLTTSVTSNTISNTNKTFTIGTGLSYTPTQNITISFDAAHHMHGEVLTYNSGTGVLTVDIKNHTGSGTYTAWVVNVGGVTPATSVAWGAITGTLSTQTDLQGELDLKANLVAPVFTSGIEVDGGVTITGPSGNPTFTYSGLDLSPSGSGGITFSDSTVQTTAAVAPPSADVLTANAIAANVNFITGSTGTWVGNGLPSIAGLIGWGVYNATDGLIAYSYSSGSTFYLASAISTSNDTVQVSGSNSSFYIA
jgi:hypothetical protein